MTDEQNTENEVEGQLSKVRFRGEDEPEEVEGQGSKIRFRGEGEPEEVEGHPLRFRGEGEPLTEEETESDESREGPEVEGQGRRGQL